MKKFESVKFTANKNTVTASKYVAHALYVQNEALVEKLGGQVIKGAGVFTAQFKTSANAKKFVANAVCSMTAKEYNATRKTETKAKVVAKAPAQGKGKADFITLTDSNGNEYKIPMSALGIAPKSGKGKKASAPKKSKAPTPAPKKGKGSNKGFDFGKLVGKGRTANKQAAALIYKTGCKPNSAEFNKLWDMWCKVR